MRLVKEIRDLIGNYHLKSGVYHYYRNEYKQAVDFLRKALRDEEELAESDIKKARHYLTLSLMDSARRLEDRGELAEAVEELRRAAEVSPHFPDIYFRVGQLLERQDHAVEAIAQYEEAVRRNASYLDAEVARGFCLLRSGLVDAAREAFARALELRLAQVREPHAAGLRCLDEDDIEAAGEFFRQAFLASPRLSEEIVSKAMSRLREEDYEGAILELDRALALNPKYPDLHNYRGVALSELGRHEEAATAFRRSCESSPNFTVARLNLAFSYLRAGEYKAAEAELETILSREPTESAALALMAEVEKEGRPEKRRPVTRGNPR